MRRRPRGRRGDLPRRRGRSRWTAPGPARRSTACACARPVATSGISSRLWRRADGAFAHHLLDPSTGEPAWTGLVAVTAVAATTVAAEVVAKTALLEGPARARTLLARRGGVLQHDDGRVEIVAGPPAVRLKRPLARQAA